MVKPLHAGAAARNGVMAARLAQKGFVASEQALDGPQGYLAAMDSEGPPAALLHGLGRRPERGLPRRCAVHHDARHHRVGGDRGARAGTGWWGWTATGCSRPWATSSRPADHPELYGGGQRGERVVEAIDEWARQ